VTQQHNQHLLIQLLHQQIRLIQQLLQILDRQKQHLIPPQQMLLHLLKKQKHQHQHLHHQPMENNHKKISQINHQKQVPNKKLIQHQYQKKPSQLKLLLKHQRKQRILNQIHQMDRRQLSKMQIKKKKYKNKF